MLRAESGRSAGSRVHAVQVAFLSGLRARSAEYHALCWERDTHLCLREGLRLLATAVA